VRVLIREDDTLVGQAGGNDRGAKLVKAPGDQDRGQRVDAECGILSESTQ
jgi:hypothetical protein